MDAYFAARFTGRQLLRQNKNCRSSDCLSESSTGYASRNGLLFTPAGFGGFFRKSFAFFRGEAIHAGLSAL
ncbi:MAG: hypothetical protein AB7I35_09670 [Ramlibacter sp.]